MRLEIKITIEATQENWNEKELISDIQWQFVDITGYEPQEIEIEKL